MEHSFPSCSKHKENVLKCFWNNAQMMFLCFEIFITDLSGPVFLTWGEWRALFFRFLGLSSSSSVVHLVFDVVFSLVSCCFCADGRERAAVSLVCLTESSVRRVRQVSLLLLCSKSAVLLSFSPYFLHFCNWYPSFSYASQISFSCFAVMHSEQKIFNQVRPD